jgi:hypothetical protein
MAPKPKRQKTGPSDDAAEESTPPPEQPAAEGSSRLIAEVFIFNFYFLKIYLLTLANTHHAAHLLSDHCTHSCQLPHREDSQRRDRRVLFLLLFVLFFIWPCLFVRDVVKIIKQCLSKECLSFQYVEK